MKELTEQSMINKGIRINIFRIVYVDESNY